MYLSNQILNLRTVSESLCGHNHFGSHAQLLFAIVESLVDIMAGSWTMHFGPQGSIK